MATYLFSDYEALSKTVNVQPRNAIYWETFSCPPTPQDTATPPPTPCLCTVSGNPLCVSCLGAYLFASSLKQVETADSGKKSI